MICLCIYCGSFKGEPASACALCGRLPETEEDVARSLLLSEAHLSHQALQETAEAMASGRAIELPQDMVDAVAKRLQTAKESARNLFYLKVFAGIAFALFLCYQMPGVRYGWAAFRNTIPAYESYLEAFPRSDYAGRAAHHLRLLREDGVWSAALSSGTRAAYLDYLRIYPDGKYLAEARQELEDLAAIEWKKEVAQSEDVDRLRQYLRDHAGLAYEAAARERLGQVIVARAQALVAASRDVEALQAFLPAYPEAPPQAGEILQARIRELHDDIDWIIERADLALGKDFMKRFPSHPRRAELDKLLIDLEINAIATGNFGEMPAPDLVRQGGSMVSVNLKNDTGYELTVLYSGPTSKRVVIAVGESRFFQLPPGDYKTAASVASASVSSYYGNQNMQAGDYDSSFYIKRTGMYEPLEPKLKLPDLNLPVLPR